MRRETRILVLEILMFLEKSLEDPNLIEFRDVIRRQRQELWRLLQSEPDL